MVFHYSSSPLLFATERYALVTAVLYVDNWMAYEYIVNTNSCTAMISASLLVHELRDAGVQERIHGDLAHTVTLSMLVAINLLVLVCGENHPFKNIVSVMGSSSVPTLPSSNLDMHPGKKSRHQQSNLHTAHYSSSTYSASALVCVLCNCILLVVLSTCAMPASTHDPSITNLRVWSFMMLSLTWLYTIYYRELRYSIVAPFTPCVLRFSSILFLTPTPFAVGGITLMAGVLAVVHIRLEIQQHDVQSLNGCTTDHVYQQTNTTDKAVVVSRDPQAGSVSYRVPIALVDDNSDCVALSISNSGGSVGTSTGVGGLVGGTLLDADPALTTQQPSVDYNTLFQQVMDERST
jgi:hypothetical protein